MRIAFVTSESGLGGGETSLLNLIRAGNELWQSLLICPPGVLSDDARSHGIAVRNMDFPDAHLRLQMLPSFSWSAFRQMRQTIVAERIDILHAESLLALVYGGPAARTSGIPCVAIYHGYWPLQSRWARTLVASCCDSVYPVSRAVARELGFCSARASVVPLGFAQEFGSDLPDRREARTRLRLPINAHIVLQVGRFQPVKGQLTLLRAVELLFSRSGETDLMLLFAGGVLDVRDQESLDYREQIRALADRPDLRGHVLLLGHRRDIPLLMRAADIVVCPSDFETFGMNVIEAMAVGTPVIATDAGGPADLLKDRQTGRLVPPRDHSSLARAIDELLGDPVEAERMARAAQESAHVNYSPAVRARTLNTAYRLQLTAHSPRLSAFARRLFAVSCRLSAD
jgi:D-inositol-3-phosphate glycosyltransferase